MTTVARNVRQLALSVLPGFAEAVLARQVHTYGYYARQIGRDSKEAIVIGPAMHVIGAACVFRCVPVAPLFFVKRADGEWRGVFEADALEERDVLPHFDTLYVAARVYSYTREDFQQVEKALIAMESVDTIGDYSLSQHHLWHLALVKKPVGSSETYFHRALAHYRHVIEQERAKRKKVGWAIR